VIAVQASSTRTLLAGQDAAAGDAYFSYKKVLYGMPWSLSNPILW